MGNCLKPLDSDGDSDVSHDPAQSKWHNTSRKHNFNEMRSGDMIEDEVHNSAHYPVDEQNPAGLSIATKPSPKSETSWRRFLQQTRSGSAQSKDHEDCSIFGENWDPELFDQRPISSPDAGDLTITTTDPNRIPTVSQPHTKLHHDTWTYWASGDSLNHTPGLRKPRLPVLPSTLLGFSPYPAGCNDAIEWYRNGELEIAKPDTHSFLIKGKHRICRSTPRPSHERNGTPETGQEESQPSGLLREGWLRYTMYVHQDKTEVCRFHTRFRTAKHVFLSLEAKTGCELRLSKRLFVYRGKLVRLFVIDGPSRKAIIRCYTSMPACLTEKIISECERPSMLEPQPAAPEVGSRGLHAQPMLANPIAV